VKVSNLGFDAVSTIFLESKCSPLGPWAPGEALAISETASVKSKAKNTNAEIPRKFRSDKMLTDIMNPKNTIISRP
jgi:hypothetical protein